MWDLNKGLWFSLKKKNKGMFFFLETNTHTHKSMLTSIFWRFVLTWLFYESFNTTFMKNIKIYQKISYFFLFP